MIDLTHLLLLAVAVAAGGLAQGTTGIGFALVAAPACALVLDPADVVGTVVRLGLVVDVLLAILWRSAIDLRVARAYSLAALAAAPVGVAVATVAPPAALVLVTATATLAGAVVLLTGAPVPVPATQTSLAPRLAAGFASGLMGVTAGMPGPPVAIDAARRHVPPAQLRATLAVFFAGIDLVAAVVNPRAVAVGPMVLLVGAAVAGLAVAGLVADRVDPKRTAELVGILVAVGALAAILRQVL